ncbi:hypothetical protein ABPG75_012826 [Micractinium tetrahymenae]
MAAARPARLGHPLPAAGERAAAAPAQRSSRPAALRPRASSRGQAELLQEAPAARYNGTVPASGAPANGLSNGSHRNGGGSGSTSAAGAAAAAVTDAGLIITTFRWPAALGGHQVSVCGSFSNWEPMALHQAAPGGDFVRSLALPPGSAYFKYLVDGEWICSPTEQVVANGKGFNNHRLVQPTATFTWRSSELGGADVLLTGSFNSWAELLPLAYDTRAGQHSLRCCLPQGHYEFQFFVDGQWLLCPQQPTSLTEQGRLVNCVEVQSPPAYHIHYATGWTSAVLHVRPVAAPGQPEAPWQALPMHSTASRARPKGGNWLTATVPAMLAQGDAGINGNGNGNRHGINGAPAAAAAAAAAGRVAGLSVDGGDAASASYRPIEFFISSSDGRHEDRPWGGSTYRCQHPGGYKLRSGGLRPFPQATRPPMMLVSDLDGTMVGEGEEADACTREFATYWEENAALAGGVLVYNTGRSLGQFQGLLEYKAGALPVPDVLITAVGTKIWRLDCEGGTRGTASGTAWQEDHQWARTLDEGWNLGQIRECVQQVLDRRSDAAFWLDNGTEHPHRVCISTRADVTATVMAELERGVAGSGLQCKVIVSGTGDWRYVDVTAARAGKLAALEYVRQLYGVHHSRCVAAGDSGNDTLMLGGRNLAIVVGNAQPELVQWVLGQPQEERMVVTDAPMARGILEGLARHGLY